MVTLSPFIPLPLDKGKGEVISLEGLRPSKIPLNYYSRVRREEFVF